MLIHSLAPWAGGKRTLAPQIVQEIGEPKVYVEPLCGSCAVLFAKPVSRVEIINDVHGGIINVAMVLASGPWRELHDGVSRLLFCKPLHAAYRLAAEQTVTPPPAPRDVTDQHVEAAIASVVAWWMGRKGLAGTTEEIAPMAHRYTPAGGSGPVGWQSVVSSISEWHERLQRVDIQNTDVFTLLSKIRDRDDTALYLDPSYWAQSLKYRFDFTPEAHERLAAFLRRFREARVLVSAYDRPEDVRLCPGWTKRSLPSPNRLAAQSSQDGRNLARAPEVLLINGPSLAV